MWAQNIYNWDLHAKTGPFNFLIYATRNWRNLKELTDIASLFSSLNFYGEMIEVSL